MEKTLEELKFVLSMREKDFPGESRVHKEQNGEVYDLNSPTLALCLSSRRNLCIHKEVSKEDDRERVDSKCRQLTASWVREKAGVDSSMHLNNGSSMLMSNKVTDIEDLHKSMQICSFYE